MIINDSLDIYYFKNLSDTSGAANIQNLFAAQRKWKLSDIKIQKSGYVY